MYKGNPVRLKPDFSSGTIEARRHWDDIKCRKKEQMSTKIVIYCKTLFKN